MLDLVDAGAFLALTGAFVEFAGTAGLTVVGVAVAGLPGSVAETVGAGGGVGGATPIVSISLKKTRRFSSIARFERITAVESASPTSKSARGRLPLRTSLKTF